VWCEEVLVLNKPNFTSGMHLVADGELHTWPAPAVRTATSSHARLAMASAGLPSV
jgi:hypothetical protein